MLVHLISLLCHDLLQDKSDGTLHWETVQEWIEIYGNRDNIDRSCLGDSPPANGAAGYVELVRGNWGGTLYLHATIVFDPRSGPVAAMTWEAKKLDRKLENLFGNNLQIRLNI